MCRYLITKVYDSSHKVMPTLTLHDTNMWSGDRYMQSFLQGHISYSFWESSANNWVTLLTKKGVNHKILWVILDKLFLKIYPIDVWGEKKMLWKIYSSILWASKKSNRKNLSKEVAISQGCSVRRSGKNLESVSTSICASGNATLSIFAR